MRVLKVVTLGVEGFVAIVGCIAVVIYVAQYLEDARREQLAHLDSSVDEYLSVIENSPSGSTPVDERPSGKVVFVCIQSNSNSGFGTTRPSRRVDGTTLDLPKELFPQASDDVGVIVALRWGEELIGLYDNGARGFQERCQADVYSRSTGQLIASRSFVGQEPPGRISRHTASGASVFGPGCQDEIVAFVAALFG